MDSYNIKELVLLSSNVLPVVTGIFRYRKLDTGSRIIFLLCGLFLLCELLAWYAAIRFRNNLPVYNCCNIMELFLVCLYFNHTVKRLRQCPSGFLLAAASLLIGIVNNFFIQSPFRIASYFLFYQSLCTVGIGIFSLISFINSKELRQPKTEVHFWFTVLLIFSSGITYLLYLVLAFHPIDLKFAAPVVLPALLLVNILTCISIAAIFLLYPKMHHHV